MISIEYYINCLIACTSSKYCLDENIIKPFIMIVKCFDSAVRLLSILIWEMLILLK